MHVQLREHAGPLGAGDATRTQSALSSAPSVTACNADSLYIAGSRKLARDPTRSTGREFDEREFDRSLESFLSDVRREAQLPRVITKVQKWWRMKMQRRKFLRFKSATRLFCNRSQMQIMKAWHFVATAQNWERGTLLSNHLSAWRMLARNSTNWSEESAVIFVECMRAQAALQQALFLELNDKRVFRRAGVEYNWGRGWKFGRPLPTREHVMVVQVLRHKLMWLAKSRVRRWYKYLVWRHSQRATATTKLKCWLRERLNQKGVLCMIMWHRWAVVMRCERHLQNAPVFEPELLQWEQWYSKHMIDKQQGDKRQLDQDNVHSLKWRFLCRSMWVAWVDYLDDKREEDSIMDKIRDWTKKRALQTALRGWVDVRNEQKADQHRTRKILFELRAYVRIRSSRKTAGAVIAHKWHHREVKKGFKDWLKMTTFMLVVSAGGLNRLRRKISLGKWALLAWLAHGSPIDGPERKPGGLCLLGVCDAHFALLDCWRRWAALARGRLRMKKLLLSSFYQSNVYSRLLPAFAAWKMLQRGDGLGESGQVEIQLPVGEEKVHSYQMWSDHVRPHHGGFSLSMYCQG